jgi:hypothetical protein
MSWEELSYRLRDRFNSYFHSEKRSVKILSRFLAFTFFAAIISTIAPTLADELSTDPSMMQPVSQSSETTTVSTSETVTASPTPEATFSPAPVVNRPPVANDSAQPLAESSESATAAGPGIPLEIQPAYEMKIPRTVAIDPRAVNRYLPLVYASVSDPDVEFTMVCISGPGLRIDAMAKGSANNSDEGSDLISGDLSGQLIISATTNRVINLINSQNGLFISSQSGGLAGRNLTFRFVAVTKPVADPVHCGAAQSGAVTSIRPLALDLSTVKGGGSLK